MTLERYILRSFARALLSVLGVIALVIALFSGVENIRRFGDAEFGSAGLLRVTLLQVPETLYQAFPLVMLLASLVTFLRLARSSELVVMRASGVSALRLVGIPVVAGIAVGAVLIAVLNPFVAATIEQSQAEEDSLRGLSTSRMSVSSEGLWLRQSNAGGQTVIHAVRANANGTILTRVQMHRFDESGTLTGRIVSPAARLTDGAWVLEAATAWEIDAEGRYGLASDGTRLRLPTDLTSDQILDSLSPPEMLSVWQLPQFIAQMEDSGFSAVRHRLFLQSELAKPVLFAAMVLIGSAFALRPQRFGQSGVMVVLAVLCGFGLYFLKDFAESLGAQQQIPLLVAAWTPPVAAILLALGLLLHLEDG